MSAPASAAKQLLKVGEVADMLSMGIRTIWRKVAANQFPQPVRFNKVLVRWRAQDIQHYLDNLK